MKKRASNSTMASMGFMLFVLMIIMLGQDQFFFNSRPQDSFINTSTPHDAINYHNNHGGNNISSISYSFFIKEFNFYMCVYSLTMLSYKNIYHTIMCKLLWPSVKMFIITYHHKLNDTRIFTYKLREMCCNNNISNTISQMKSGKSEMYIKYTNITLIVAC